VPGAIHLHYSDNIIQLATVYWEIKASLSLETACTHTATSTYDVATNITALISTC